MTDSPAEIQIQTGKAPPISVFSVFSVFGRSCSLFFRYLPQNIVFGLIGVLPFVAILAVTPDTLLSEYRLTDIASILGVIFFLGQLAIYSVASRAITTFSLQRLAGAKPELFTSLGNGLIGMLPVYIGTILTHIGFGLGLILLVIPGLYFIATYALVTPAIVREGLGVKDAFFRSKTLVIGYRWKILVALLVLAIFYSIIQFVGLSAFQLMYLIHDAEIVNFAEANSKIPMTNAIGTPMYVFAVIFIAALYDEIRNAKEGCRQDEVAAVFD
ncbi:hypothetical protein EOI86_05180 [Hwanghaeella grinnelliae]|uniref:Glycerophosphoryl diester phosphodiesterase membrane domain-containing protein n=1 Tax=Hwanghaeella grinnelliae TaxID=2500179 RepID=A0A437QVW9_9PROT|nr:hypothetical protein [Hwanghaeella grinnelliae]RVU38671.1 hypothetical protein EOI86_05180 [Hwanghaeella grinnelliae]